MAFGGNHWDTLGRVLELVTNLKPEDCKVGLVLGKSSREQRPVDTWRWFRSPTETWEATALPLSYARIKSLNIMN